MNPEGAVASSRASQIKVRIDSIPPAARVVLRADRSVLGHTPLAVERPRSASPLAVVIELDGFKPKDVAVPLTTDFEGSFKL